jgi:quinol monooxygenase YgiN
MSKFNELYGYLSDRQTPHLFVMAEIMYSIKESMDQHNQQMVQLNQKLDTLIDLTREQGSKGSESSEN